MVARTSLALLLIARVAAADASDAEIIGRDPGWRVDDVQLRSSYLWQRGHGFQSVDGSVGAAGSEEMWVFEPFVLITIHQSDTITHEVTVPVDVISAASPDAVDALTSASRVNEAVDVDVRSTYKRGEHDTLTTRFDAHYEEPLSSGTAGAGWRHSLADDNATLGASAYLTIDGFDGRDHFGNYYGKTARETVNANVTASQLLSPTTIVDGSYGITVQHGTLSTGWNAVPVMTGDYADEVLPSERVRHALAARIAQHLPWTHSTVKVAYRFYADDFSLTAHTVELVGYQYLVPWLYARASYRYYHQTGVDFFTTGLSPMFDPRTEHTADSDLAPFAANEWSVSLAMVRDRAPRALQGWALGAELLHYWRTNDLQITMVSLTAGRRL